MARIRDLIERKGTEVSTIGPQATVLQAALLMNEHRIGSLVVCDGGRLIGMFTERDVLQRVVAEHRDPTTTLVEDVMTTDVVCCRPDTTVDEARAVMMNQRVRHLPVIEEEGRLHGLISIGDLNAHLLATQEFTLYMMDEYIHGRV